MANYKVIYVEWIDAATDMGWESVKECAMDIDICQTVGWLIKETKLSLIIAGSLGHTYGKGYPDDSQSNNRIAIPKAWIKKKKVIKL